eukprot:Nk52_evm17s221 gene=Nk52_evmTU17s221
MFLVVTSTEAFLFFFFILDILGNGGWGGGSMSISGSFCFGLNICSISELACTPYFDTGVLNSNFRPTDKGVVGNKTEDNRIQITLVPIMRVNPVWDDMPWTSIQELRARKPNLPREQWREGLKGLRYMKAEGFYSKQWPDLKMINTSPVLSDTLNSCRDLGSGEDARDRVVSVFVYVFNFESMGTFFQQFPNLEEVYLWFEEEEDWGESVLGREEEGPIKEERSSAGAMKLDYYNGEKKKENPSRRILFLEDTLFKGLTRLRVVSIANVKLIFNPLNGAGAGNEVDYFLARKNLIPVGNFLGFASWRGDGTKNGKGEEFRWDKSPFSDLRLVEIIIPNADFSNFSVYDRATEESPPSPSSSSPANSYQSSLYVLKHGGPVFPNLIALRLMDVGLLPNTDDLCFYHCPKLSQVWLSFFSANALQQSMETFVGWDEDSRVGRKPRRGYFQTQLPTSVLFTTSYENIKRQRGHNVGAEATAQEAFETLKTHQALALSHRKAILQWLFPGNFKYIAPPHVVYDKEFVDHLNAYPSIRMLSFNYGVSFPVYGVIEGSMGLAKDRDAEGPLRVIRRQQELIAGLVNRYHAGSTGKQSQLIGNDISNGKNSQNIPVSVNTCEVVISTPLLVDADSHSSMRDVNEAMEVDIWNRFVNTTSVRVDCLVPAAGYGMGVANRVKLAPIDAEGFQERIRMYHNNSDGGAQNGTHKSWKYSCLQDDEVLSEDGEDFMVPLKFFHAGQCIVEDLNFLAVHNVTTMDVFELENTNTVDFDSLFECSKYYNPTKDHGSNHYSDKLKECCAGARFRNLKRIKIVNITTFKEVPAFAFCNMPALRIIDLRDNAIERVHPLAFQNPEGLEYNPEMVKRMIQPISRQGQRWYIEQILLSGNVIPALPDDLLKNCYVKDANFSFNQLGGFGSSFVCGFPSCRIQAIDFSHNHLGEDFMNCPRCLGYVFYESWDASVNDLQEVLFDASYNFLASPPGSVIYIDLWEEVFAESMAEFDAYLASKPPVERNYGSPRPSPFKITMRWSNNNFSNFHLRYTAPQNYTALKKDFRVIEVSLDLRNNSVTDLSHDLARYGAECPILLTALRLDHNPISEIHPDLFSCHHGSLETFTASHGNLQFLPKLLFNEMPRLSYIDLSHNNISRITSPIIYRSCTDVSRPDCVFDLSYNLMGRSYSPFESAGTNPGEWIQESKIQTVDVSYNQFASYPREIYESVFSMLEKNQKQQNKREYSLKNSRIVRPYMTFSLKGNYIKSVKTPICMLEPTAIDLSTQKRICSTSMNLMGETQTIYIDLSDNELQYISEEALMCCEKLLLNLNGNRFESLPRLNTVNEQIILLSLARNNKLHSIPHNLMTSLVGLQSLNLPDANIPCCSIGRTNSLLKTDILNAFDPDMKFTYNRLLYFLQSLKDSTTAKYMFMYLQCLIPKDIANVASTTIVDPAILTTVKKIAPLHSSGKFRTSTILSVFGPSANVFRPDYCSTCEDLNFMSPITDSRSICIPQTSNNESKTRRRGDRLESPSAPPLVSAYRQCQNGLYGDGFSCQKECSIDNSTLANDSTKENQCGPNTYCDGMGNNCTCLEGYRFSNNIELNGLCWRIDQIEPDTAKNDSPSIFVLLVCVLLLCIIYAFVVMFSTTLTCVCVERHKLQNSLARGVYQAAGVRLVVDSEVGCENKHPGANDLSYAHYDNGEYLYSDKREYRLDDRGGAYIYCDGRGTAISGKGKEENGYDNYADFPIYYSRYDTNPIEQHCYAIVCDEPDSEDEEGDGFQFAYGISVIESKSIFKTSTDNAQAIQYEGMEAQKEIPVLCGRAKYNVKSVESNETRSPGLHEEEEWPKESHVRKSGNCVGDSYYSYYEQVGRADSPVKVFRYSSSSKRAIESFVDYLWVETNVSLHPAYIFTLCMYKTPLQEGGMAKAHEDMFEEGIKRGYLGPLTLLDSAKFRMNTSKNGQVLGKESCVESKKESMISTLASNDEEGDACNEGVYEYAYSYEEMEIDAEQVQAYPERIGG